LPYSHCAAECSDCTIEQQEIDFAERCKDEPGLEELWWQSPGPYTEQIERIKGTVVPDPDTAAIDATPMKAIVYGLDRDRVSEDFTPKPHSRDSHVTQEIILRRLGLPVAQRVIHACPRCQSTQFVRVGEARRCAECNMLVPELFFKAETKSRREEHRAPLCQVVLLPESQDALKAEIRYFEKYRRVIPSARREKSRNPHLLAPEDFGPDAVRPEDSKPNLEQPSAVLAAEW
jgi:hypothetical protein